MTEVPVISITRDENDDDNNEDESSRRPSINDCHTDIEDLDSEQDRNPLISVLKQSAKCNGAVTDVEDYDDSGDDAEEPERDYGPEISLNEFLDQGSVDELANSKGNEKKKLENMHSIVRSPSPSAFNLSVQQDLGGVTDCEDLEDSGDDDEQDKVYSDDDKAIVLEGANAVDIHDSVNSRKKLEKYAPKIIEPSESKDSSSSESEDEKPEKPKLRLKPHKHSSKRGQRIEEAKSDVENITLSDDDRRKCKTSPPVLETPDVEVMAFEGSDTDDVPDTPKFPEINISFTVDTTPKSKPKVTRTPVLLVLPDNQDEGLTDVENLNSSDDESDQAEKSKDFIPIAVAKSDALTDVEDFGEGSEEDGSSDEKPEIPLPSPVREFTVFVEDKNGEPVKQTTPLPDNVLLGFHDLDADKGLTDVEDFSDEDDNDDDGDVPDYNIDSIPDLDGGVVESSDHAADMKASSLNVSVTPEPVTDQEDILVKKRQEKGSECRRRRTKTKHSQSRPKSTFLDTKFYDDAVASGAHTDCEDMNVEDDDEILKDKGLKQRRSTVDNCARRSSSNNNDGKTDVEYMSGDDIIDLLRYSPDVKELLDFSMETCTMTRFHEVVDSRSKSSFLDMALPDIVRISPTQENCNTNTDIEDVQCNSENENEDYAVTFSRAQTATPLELNRDLDDLCTSHIHEINSRAFDRVGERHEIKENLCATESHTDIENFDGDEN